MFNVRQEKIEKVSRDIQGEKVDRELDNSGQCVLHITIGSYAIASSKTAIPGVRKSKRRLHAFHIETTRNSVKVTFGIKLMKYVKMLIDMEVIVVGRRSEYHLFFMGGRLYIAE